MSTPRAKGKAKGEPAPGTPPDDDTKNAFLRDLMLVKVEAKRLAFVKSREAMAPIQQQRLTRPEAKELLASIRSAANKLLSIFDERPELRHFMASRLANDFDLSDWLRQTERLRDRANLTPQDSGLWHPRLGWREFRGKGRAVDPFRRHVLINTALAFLRAKVRPTIGDQGLYSQWIERVYRECNQARVPLDRRELGMAVIEAMMIHAEEQGRITKEQLEEFRKKIPLLPRGEAAKWLVSSSRAVNSDRDERHEAQTRR